MVSASIIFLIFRAADEYETLCFNKLACTITWGDTMYIAVKRALDIIFSVLALIILAIPLAILALLVRSKLGSPVIFTQKRPGRDEKPFLLRKFRTMTDKCDEKGELLPDSERLTLFGRKLRSTSLDELPELFNILTGDMSFVGPRPLLMRYLPRYNERQKRRHEVRPGLTGLAQVSGRNAISWEQKFELDVQYVESINLWLDIKIFFKTVSAVFKREGISSGTSDTMEEFMGS